MDDLVNYSDSSDPIIRFFFSPSPSSSRLCSFRLAIFVTEEADEGGASPSRDGASPSISNPWNVGMC